MRTIRIRQLSLEEARRILENELNEAFMNGETRVEILHGIGTGALKKLTREVVQESGFAYLADDSVYPNPGITQVHLEPPDKTTLRMLRK